MYFYLLVFTITEFVISLSKYTIFSSEQGQTINVLTGPSVEEDRTK